MEPVRVLACSLVLLLGGVTAGGASAVFREVHGEHRRVRVEDGETLTGLAAEDGVPWWAVATVNHSTVLEKKATCLQKGNEKPEHKQPRLRCEDAL